MTSRRFVEPPHWSDEALEAHRRQAIANFIAERNAEGGTHYRAAFARNLASVEHLFSATNDLLDFATGDAIAMSPALIHADG